ncbi:MAG: GYD domain-containing protein [Candidatus Nealsonbacteria bacterium]|nr:GYD domain-containing protein [Candidatus Nealsonbacteria bacterium]
MATFFIFGRYSSESIKSVSVERTRRVHSVIEEVGGHVKGIYALMGEYDVVIIAELPNMGEAMKASVALKRLTDISFFTTAAMPIEEFDQLVGEM